MLFERHKPADYKQNQCKRHHTVAERLHLLAVGRHERRKRQNDRNLRQLRGLERGKANPDPALRSALLRAENRDEQQKEHRHRQHDERHASPELIVDARDEEHPADTEHGKNRLPGKIVRGVSLFKVGSCVARREDHNDADGHKQHHQHQKRKIEQSPFVHHNAAVLVSSDGQALSLCADDGGI